MPFDPGARNNVFDDASRFNSQSPRIVLLIARKRTRLPHEQIDWTELADSEIAGACMSTETHCLNANLQLSSLQSIPSYDCLLRHIASLVYPSNICIMCSSLVVMRLWTPIAFTVIASQAKSFRTCQHPSYGNLQYLLQWNKCWYHDFLVLIFSRTVQQPNCFLQSALWSWN